MAILIPSKNIYDKQNPKVRDNVIERIEVGANVVNRYIDYNKSVFTETYFPIDKIKYSYDSGNVTVVNQKDIITGINVILGAGTKVIYNYSYIPTIRIDKLKNNTLTNKIYTNKKNDGEPEISITPKIRQKTGLCYTNGSFEFISNSVGTFDYQRIENVIEYTTSTNEKNLSNFGYLGLNGNAHNIWFTFSIDMENETTSGYRAIFDVIEANPTLVVGKEPNTANGTIGSYVKYTNAYYNQQSTIGRSLNLNNLLNDIKIDGNVSSVLNDIQISEYEDFYEINNLKVLSEIIYIANCVAFGATTDHVINGKFYPQDTNTFFCKQEALSYDITINGDTIGIDLQENTVYINGETAKKVHSVDGNELMQTSNYYQSTDTNAITMAFTETQTDYAKGKETATIRCSICDYYDYDSGDKVISIDNSTGKMSFKMYDQVIPMVYGADRQDHPMSTYQDGSAKVFQVLGSNIYYDGAVWQELSLQEVDKNEIL